MDPSSHASILNKGKRGKKNKQSEWKCHASLSAHDQKHGCHNIKNVPILGQCKHHHSLVHTTKWIICFTSIIFQLGSMHIWGGGKEKKMSKDECELFYNQIDMNQLT